jgi:hygromycin-B 4-O-kinase
MAVRLDQAKQFLSARYSPEQVAHLGAGEWSSAFVFDHHGRRLVARFGRHLEDFRKDQVAATSFGASLPIPPVLEIGEAFSGYFYAISEWAGGDPIDRLSEPVLRAAQPLLLDALDRIRSAPPPTGAGFGWWSSRGTAAHDSWREALLGIAEDEESPRLAGWRTFLRSRAECSRVFDTAAARLAELAGSCPDAVRCVIHADLTAGNVLFREGSVSAVFDWGNSLVGDFLYDVAWLVFWSPWHPGLDAGWIISETRRRCAESGFDLSNWTERLHACQLHMALDSMAYNAFRRNELHMGRTIERLLPLLDARRAPSGK